jgi:hypothetical protein
LKAFAIDNCPALFRKFNVTSFFSPFSSVCILEILRFIPCKTNCPETLGLGRPLAFVYMDGLCLPPGSPRLVTADDLDRDKGHP